MFLFLTALFAIGRAENYLVHTAEEIATVCKSVQAGDTLFMATGLWTDQQILFSGNGEEGNPIVLIPQETGKVILTGFSTLRIWGTYLEVNGLRFVGGYPRSGAVVEFRKSGSSVSHHCRLTNTSIVDYNPPYKSYEYKWVSLYGSHNRVDHCYFKGKTNLGATLVVWLSAQPNYHLIDHNYFAHRPELGENGGETIRIGTSDWSMYDSFTTVEYNYFEQCDGEIEIISSKSGGNIYRYNTFFDNAGMLTLRHGNHNIVEGNFFFGNKNYRAGGVRIIGEDHVIFNNYFEGIYGDGFRSALTMMNGVENSPLDRYFQVKNAIVAFNTFVDCRNTFTIGAGADEELTLPPENCIIANNAVITDYDVVQFDDTPINLSWIGNLIQSPDLGIPKPPGIDLLDLLFERGNDQIWRPSAASPVIDAAVGNYPFLLSDMDGQERLGAFDVGADEYSAEPVKISPMSSLTTGPEWLNSVEIYMLLATRISGQGKLEIDPPGGLYDLGQLVTIKAIPDSGWRFVRWTGSVEDTAPQITVIMDESKLLVAEFEMDVPPQYVVTTYVFSKGGHIQLSPVKEFYSEGEVVVVTAVADSGFEFVGWGGALSGNRNPDTLIVNADLNLLATFRPIPTLVAAREEPRGYALGQNYPNPFNMSTTIPFSMAAGAHVRVEVFNTLGQKVATVADQYFGAGDWHVPWDGTDETGRLVQSGLYFYRMKAGDFVAYRKLSVVK